MKTRLRGEIWAGCLTPTGVEAYEYGFSLRFTKMF